jgi:hypothetical protein
MANGIYDFTQPIRYYKANDPYFYEVDNLPLRQLEENVLYLKQKLEGTDDGTEPEPTDPEFEAYRGRYLTGNSEISITNIKELKPKLVSGRTLQVNAGKFVARVNDTYNITTPLSRLLESYGGPGDTVPGVGSIPAIVPQLTRVWGLGAKNAVWSAFINSMATGGNAYNMNGLEVNYTFHSTPGSMGGNWGTRNDPGGPTSQTVGDGANHQTFWGYPFYNFAGSWWDYMDWPGVDAIKALTPGGGNQGTATSVNLEWGYKKLPNLHQEFVKVWRSPFRTAVVDFPNSTIEVPTFTDADFRLMTQDFEVSSLAPNATHRIDLLVAYTMSIDSSSAALNNYASTFCGNDPEAKTITQPILGLVQGAGFGISKGVLSNYDNPATVNAFNECNEGIQGEGGVSLGNTKLLGNTNDETVAANYGITDSLGVKIHGSFPSPDDLLNLAPILAFNSVDATDFQRIGQTALPIAYVVVRKGATSISSNDIIDIRPFLRTTEFTYNERAGIAAANPPLSLANPAIGAYQLQDTVNKIYTSMGTLVGDGSTAESGLGQALYTDYVMGGLGFGVEGTLLTMNDNSIDPTDPWGTESQQAQYAGEGFTSYTGSKAFLEDTSEIRRHAFLSYLYNSRQADLKRWLENPNNSNNQGGSYLNLPSMRKIPLWPEWDPPVDESNYLQVMSGNTAGNTTPAAPQATWWMWFEGVNRARPFRYVPGGVISTDTADGDAALNKEYLPGFDKAGVADHEYTAFTQMSSKKLEVILPSWVNDYDVLVEYVNCNPMSYAGDDIGGDLYEPHLGLGNGLSVNKGPVTTGGGQKKTTFEIMSQGQSIPANVMLRNSDGRINGNIVLSPVQDAYYKFLTYSVILPQFREQMWRTESQAGGNVSNTLRFTPKTGASYYPTVKFTIIGYPDNKITQNTNLQDNGTLIPSSAIGIESNLVSAAYPPIYDRTVIDIENLT